MNETSSIRTNSLSSKSGLPPFHFRGFEQILYHTKDAFPRTQARPKSSSALLQSRPLSSTPRPQSYYMTKPLPLAIEASSASTTDSSTHTKSNSDGKVTTSRRASINDRNVQILRAINELLTSQVDALQKQLEEESHNLRERQLDISYISEIELLAKDEIAELQQQLREKEEMIRIRDETIREKDETIREKDETIREKDEIIREKDELIHQKDAGILEQTRALIMKDKEIKDEKKELQDKDTKLNELELERRAQTAISSERTSTSRFREDCYIFPDNVPTPSSELDLTTDKRPLSKQSNLTKGRHALKELFRESREVRSRKAAQKANMRATKDEERKKERESAESRRVSGISNASKLRPGIGVLNDENVDPNGERGRPSSRSFVRLKSLVGGKHPRVYPPSKSREFSISGSEGSRSS